MPTAFGFTVGDSMSIFYQRQLVQSDLEAARRGFEQSESTTAPTRRLIVGSLLLGAVLGYCIAGGPRVSMVASAAAGRLVNDTGLPSSSHVTKNREPVDVALAFLEAYNSADWAEMRSLTHKDYVFVSIPTNVIHRGRDLGLSHYVDFKKSSPDDQAVIQSATSTTQCFDKTNNNCSGGAVVEVVFTGTNVKSISDASIPAKGDQYRVPAVILFDIEDGMVRMTRKYYDMLTLKEQFGAS